MSGRQSELTDCNSTTMGLVDLGFRDAVVSDDDDGGFSKCRQTLESSESVLNPPKLHSMMLWAKVGPMGLWWSFGVESGARNEMKDG
jgi:hypothetical protein